MSARSTRRATAIDLLAYAWFRTKPRTAEEASACNAQFTRAKRFLLLAPAQDVAVGSVAMSADEFEGTREEAIEELQSRCRTCGLCALHGLKLP